MHFMLEEIRSEPELIESYKTREFHDLEEIMMTLRKSEIIYAIGNGTSHNAAIYLSILLNRMGMNCIPVFSSETDKWLTHRVRRTSSIVFSQSGESADIVNSVEKLKRFNSEIIGITNVENSALDRLSDLRLYTDAEKEESVAATKSHIAQLLISLRIAMQHQRDELIGLLDEVVRGAKTIVGNDRAIKEIAESATLNRMFLGSGLLYPVALETSLKLMETSNAISYAFPVREVLHGPKQLLDRKWTVFMFSRDANVYREMESYSERVLLVPDFIREKYEICTENEVIESIVSLIFGQLMSYYTSVSLGLNPDKPSKLTKVVT